MHKYISLILALVITLLSVGNVYAEEENNDILISYIMNESFDSCNIGEVGQGIVAVPKNNSLGVDSFPSTENKSLKYTVKSFDDSYIDIGLMALTGKVIIEYDVYFDNNGDGVFALFLKNAKNEESEICHFDKSLNLSTASGIQKCKCRTGRFYNVCSVINTETGCADVYVNHKMRINGEKIGNGDFKDVSLLRVHSYSIGQGTKPVVYVDNLKIYQSEYPVFMYENMGKNILEDNNNANQKIASEENMIKYMGNAVALYVNQPKIYADGEVSYINEEDKNEKPYIYNDRTLVPLRALSELLGGDINWNVSEKIAEINVGENKVEISPEEDYYLYNDEKKMLDVASQMKNNRIYVPVRAISEVFGKKVEYDKSGLIVISDKENFFDFRNDLGIFRKLCGELVFDNPSGEELVCKIKENYPNNAHPRLYADKNRIEEIKNTIKTDPNAAKWLEDVKGLAEGYFDAKPVEYDIYDGIRLLAVVQTAKYRMQDLSVLYQLTGESRYAERCVKELEAVCDFKDWNPYHFLDTSEAMEGVAFAYDWLYDYLSPELREKAKTALVEKGIKAIIEDYDDVPRRRTWKWAQSATPDNWNLVCNSGALQAAMAVGDEAEEIAVKVFDGGLNLVKNAILLYGPDGAWYEGTGYWSYATNFYIDLMSCMISVFGDTYGFMETPGVAQTGYYLNAVIGPEGAFNFHDSAPVKINSPELFFIADKLGDSGLSSLRLDQMHDRKTSGTIRDLLWYKPSAKNNVYFDKDYYFRDTEVCTMRSSWQDDSNIFVGFHAGKVNVYHGHMDTGSFIIDGYGTRYACDLGGDDYNIPDSVWNLYRYRAEGHNTLVLNPSADGGQEMSGDAVFERFESNDSSALAITDLSSCYKNSASSVKRGIKLTNNRNTILVQDEVKCINPTDLWWFMHTQQEVEVAEDGKSAIVKGKYKNMRVSLIGDVDGTFSVMKASPMETSPKNDMQNKNLTYRKLAFHAENVNDITIPIKMEFVLPVTGVELDEYEAEAVPLSDWKLDEETNIKSNRLSGIYLDGNMIDDFSEDKLTYTVNLGENDSMPSISATGDGKIEIKEADCIPGYAIITTYDKANKHIRNTYVISIKREILKKAPEEINLFMPQKITASQIPQPENSPENTVDSDLSTRWSAQGDANIIYDIGSVKTITHIGVAVYQDTTNDGRRQIFAVEISEDGKTYTPVFNGESTGTTLEEEIFTIPPTNGRYVRLQCYGTSVGNWNSITECKVYGK